MHMAGWKAKYTSHSTFTMRANCSHDHPEQSTLEQLQAACLNIWAGWAPDTTPMMSIWTGKYKCQPNSAVASCRLTTKRCSTHSHCKNKSSKWLNVYSSSWLGCAIHHLFRLTPKCFFFNPLTAITLFRYFRRKSHITRLCLTWTDCQITFWMWNIRLTGYIHKTSFPKLFFSLVLPLKFLYLPTGGKFDLRRHKVVTRIACEIKIIYASP